MELLPCSVGLLAFSAAFLATLVLGAAVAGAFFATEVPLVVNGWSKTMSK